MTWGGKSSSQRYVSNGKGAWEQKERKTFLEYLLLDECFSVIPFNPCHEQVMWVSSSSLLKARKIKSNNKWNLEEKRQGLLTCSC